MALGFMSVQHAYRGSKVRISAGIVFDTAEHMVRAYSSGQKAVEVPILPMQLAGHIESFIGHTGTYHICQTEPSPGIHRHSCQGVVGQENRYVSTAAHAQRMDGQMLDHFAGVEQAI